MKINDSKQIRMKTNWMETEIKVDLTKSFSNCACGGLKILILKEKCVKYYLHHLKS